MPICPAGHESQASDYCDTCGRVIGGAAAPTVVVGTGASAATTVTAPRAGGCPVCGAGRDGRFCEECGYDFELAEAMPETLLSPGIGPAETAVLPPQAPAPVPASVPASAEAEGAAAEQGLDLEAELARAEAQASEATPAPEAPSPDPTLIAPAPAPATSNASATETANSAGPDLGLGFAAAVSSVRAGEELNLVVNADREYYDAQLERGDIIESEFPFPKYPAERRFSFAAGPVRIGRASSSRGLSPEIDLTGPPLDPAVSHLHAQLLKHEEGWVVVDLGSANGTRLNEAAEPLEAETEIPVKPGDRIHLGVWTTIIVQ